MRSVSPLARALAETAHAAGGLILRHYSQGTEAQEKADESPVTAADEEAEQLILERLRAIEPGTAIVAEEEVAAGRTPKIGRRFFLVDPLAGTKEFISQNGEFTVNIALIEDAKPVYGVVLAPAKARLFIGDGAHGAFELASPEDLALNFDTAEGLPAPRAPATRARGRPRRRRLALASRREDRRISFQVQSGESDFRRLVVEAVPGGDGRSGFVSAPRPHHGMGHRRRPRGAGRGGRARDQARRRAVSVWEGGGRLRQPALRGAGFDLIPHVVP